MGSEHDTKPRVDNKCELTAEPIRCLPIGPADVCGCRCVREGSRACTYNNSTPHTHTRAQRVCVRARKRPRHARLRTTMIVASAEPS